MNVELNFGPHNMVFRCGTMAGLLFDKSPKINAKKFLRGGLIINQDYLLKIEVKDLVSASIHICKIKSTVGGDYRIIKEEIVGGAQVAITGQTMVLSGTNKFVDFQVEFMTKAGSANRSDYFVLVKESAFIKILEEIYENITEFKKPGSNAVNNTNVDVCFEKQNWNFN